MTEDCPVSWLRLERLSLGELTGAERATVDAHLASCDACAARLASIRGDSRPLPVLPASMPVAANRWWIPALAIAAAAIITLLPRGSAPTFPGPEIAVKGGTMAISLVRERAGDITADPATYADGDRIQVRVTCPPGDRVEVVVLTDGTAALPLESPTCGNAAVAGALRLTGSRPTAICVAAGVTRDQLAAGGLPPEAACAVLQPEP